MAQVMPLPLAVSYFSKIYLDWFYLSGIGSPGQLNGAAVVVTAGALAAIYCIVSALFHAYLY